MVKVKALAVPRHFLHIGGVDRHILMFSLGLEGGSPACGGQSSCQPMYCRITRSLVAALCIPSEVQCLPVFQLELEGPRVPSEDTGGSTAGGISGLQHRASQHHRCACSTKVVDMQPAEVICAIKAHVLAILSAQKAWLSSQIA